MAKNVTETTDTDLVGNNESMDDSETSEDKSVTSTNDTDSEDKDSESTEPEKDAGEEAKSDEETFDQKVSRLAKSMADKQMKTYQTKLSEHEKQISTLTEQLNEKTWERGINSYFDEESESKDEDTAKKNKEAREEIKKQVLEWQKNRAYVEKTKPELEQQESFLNIVERDQQAKEEVWKLLFPEDKSKVDQVTAYIKRFEKANDKEDFEIILESIRGELKVKSEKKTFKPDSGQQAGGTDWSGLSPVEKVQRGLDIEKKKIGG